MKNLYPNLENTEKLCKCSAKLYPLPMKPDAKKKKKKQGRIICFIFALNFLSNKLIPCWPKVKQYDP